MPLNQIPVVQIADAQIRILRARRHMYARGKKFLSLQLILTVGVPVVGSISILIWPHLKGIVAFASLSIAIIDATILDRIQKVIRKSAAKAQEEFDCTVMELPWDRFIVGAKLERETIHEASSKHLRGKADPTLVGWYPPIVGEAPLHLARIICQRTNLWYDSKLRRQYGGWLLGVAGGLSLLLFLAGLAGGLTLESFVLSVLAPAAPILIWSLREYYRQRDTADALDQLRSEAEALWERAKVGACTEAECAAQSRQFQNGIYERRSSSPMIFDWLYWRQRPDLENQMLRGAEDFVAEIVKGGDGKAG